LLGNSSYAYFNISAGVFVTEALQPSSISENILQNFTVSGHINNTAAENVSNASIDIFLDGTNIFEIAKFHFNNTARKNWTFPDMGYRCKIDIEETQGANVTNRVIAMNASEISTGCPSIMGARESSIRMTDFNSVEIDSKLDDWNQNKTAIGDSNATIDANDEIVFVANVSNNSKQNFYVYYDHFDTSTVDYSNPKIDLHSAEPFIIVGDQSGGHYYVKIIRNGTFDRMKHVLTLGDNIRGVAIADFDNDGDYDFTTCNDDDELCYFISQNSSGEFESQGSVGSTYTMDGNSMDMAAGDFNNDGNMDFISGGNNDDIYLFLGNGSGKFTSSAAITNAPEEVGRCKDTGDLNEDGYMDFIYADNDGGNIHAYFGNSTTEFTRSALFDTPGSSNDPYGCAVADFNMDGHLDIVAGGSSSGNFNLWRGLGNGTFIEVGAVFDTADYTAMDNWDMDSDGDQDIVLVRHDNYDNEYWVNDGTGSFTNTKQIGMIHSLGIGTPAPLFEFNLTKSFGPQETFAATDNEGKYNYTFTLNKTQIKVQEFRFLNYVSFQSV
jgi:hypothetical protein